MKSKILGLLAVGLLTGPTLANASQVVYSNEAAFLAATGSQAATLPVPTGIITNAPPTPLVLGGSPLSLTDMRYLVVDPTGGWAGYGRRMFGISGDEDFTANSTSPLYAFGFSVYEPTGTGYFGCNNADGCVQTTFRFSLYSDSTFINSFDLAPADNQWVFWGVSSTDPFNRVVVNDLTGNIDNELFSQFFCSACGIPAVPIPAAAWLLLSGLGGIAFLGRRRKSA